MNLNPLFIPSAASPIECGSSSSLKAAMLRRKYSRSGGFALVVALSLMAFVLLLLMSMVTMVKVETATAEVSRDQLKARLNAQLGAMVALGDLQKLAGPDQRVTARADILTAPGGNAIDGQAQWTGVWSSKLDLNAAPGTPLNDSYDNADGLENHKPRWLVSGDVADYADFNGRPLDITGNADAIILARQSVSVESQNQEVRVLKAPIVGSANQVEGEYAYWVSDEGVKARVNLDNPYSNSAAAEETYYNVAAAQQGDASTVELADSSRPFLPNPTGQSFWKGNSSGAGKIANYNNLSFVGAVADASATNRGFYHDLTVHSKSVFTNLRSGGLKRDLSMTLIDPDASGLAGPMFGAASGSVSYTDPGGPKWEQLGDYYRLTHDSAPGVIDFRLPTNDQVGITPVVTRYNFIIHVFASKIRDLDPGRDVAENYEYSVGIFPLITLWNPYDEDMVIPDLGLQTDMRGVFIIEGRNVGIGAGNKNDWLRNSPHFLMSVIDQWGVIPHPSDQNRNMMGMTIQGGITIPAGEAINFSPPHNSLVNFADARDNVLVPGASAEAVNGFFSAPVAMSVGASPDPTTFHDFEDNGVNISMAPHANIDSHVTNLYAQPFDNDPDESQRFMFFTSVGTGFYFRDHNWHSPRVIPVSTMGLSNFGFIKSVGSSQGNPPYDDFSPIHLSDILKREGHAIVGTARTMNFVNTEVREADKIHLLSQMNPRAQIVQDQMHVRIQQQSSYGSKNYLPRMLGFGAIPWWDGDPTPNFIGGADDVTSYIGMGNTFSSGNTQSILFEAPTRVPLGIGQFMHANLSNIGFLSYNLDDENWYSNLQQPHTAPAYAIGNSVANIHLPLNSTKEKITGNSPMFDANVSSYFASDWDGAHYDYSYELNRVLWDNFYMSTILPDNQSSIRFPLPNARVTKWNAAASDADLTTPTQSAAHLLLEGGFNVNSTSVAAWSAVLGAMRDVDTLGEGALDADTQRHNFSRFVSPDVQSTDLLPDYTDSDELVAGFRSLTDDQITDLAKWVVREIRTRRSSAGYPFLSLSDFINRSIDDNDISDDSRKRFAYMGVLQFAIDQSSINGTPAVDESWDEQNGDGLWDTGYIMDVPMASRPFVNDSLEPIRNRPFMDAAPGALTQADVLSKVGSMLTARSDTFTIRSYGRAAGKVSDASDASAYCEVTVQRIPEYHDDVDDNYDIATAETNRKFGRKFEIVSIRWLSEDEI